MEHIISRDVSPTRPWSSRQVKLERAAGVVNVSVGLWFLLFHVGVDRE